MSGDRTGSADPANPVETTSVWFADENAFADAVRDALREEYAPPKVPGVDELREIGRGGQGVVYAGVQTAFRRKVAVKVLLDAPGRTRSARGRFERELEIAASLDDPRLVRVFDGGITDDGRPFVVMEFIEGVRLDEAPVVLAARAAGFNGAAAHRAIALMAEVCAGLDAAHRRGVIHRDLKPSNILVDAAGMPHVVDFGLAKTSEFSGAGYATTGGARLLGSLPWTSPEQAEGRLEAVDVRSDVYALGATYYQLVTGTPPCPVEGDLRRALEAIATRPPEAPSRLVPTCDRDLEAVLLRALEKDPERRYATAGEFARDLRRIPLGEPIEARRETAWRALAKAAHRRRRAALAFGAVAVFAIAAVLVVSASLRTAVEQRARAERSVEFFLDAIGSVDPARDGPQTKLVDALDRISAELDGRFAGDDSARLRFRIRLRDLYIKLGRPDLALTEADAALRLAVPPEDAADPVYRSHWNGQVVRALALYLTGRNDEALQLYQQCRAALAARFKDQDLDTLGAVNGVGLVLKRLRRTDEAASALRQVVDGTAGMPRNPRVDALRANALENFAHLQELIGKPAAAEAPQREARDLFLAAEGEHTYGTINATSNLANLYLTLGRPAEAVALLEPAIQTAIKYLGPQHPLTLGAGHNYGVALLKAGRAADGRTVLSQIHEARRAKFGADASDTLLTLSELTFAVDAAGDAAEAERLRRLLVDSRRRLKDKEPLDYYISLNNLAGFLRDAGKPAEAEPLYLEATEGADRTLTPEHWIAALLRGNHARNLTDLGRFDDAEPIFRRTIATLEAKLGADHEHTRGMQGNLERNAARRAGKDSTPSSRKA